MGKINDEFHEKYPTREEKEEALRHMSDEQIDELIDGMQNIYGKIFYSRFKKNKKKER